VKPPKVAALTRAGVTVLVLLALTFLLNLTAILLRARLRARLLGRT